MIFLASNGCKIELVNILLVTSQIKNRLFIRNYNKIRMNLCWQWMQSLAGQLMFHLLPHKQKTACC